MRYLIIILLFTKLLPNSNGVRFSPYLINHYYSNGSILNAKTSTYCLINQIGIKASKETDKLSLSGDFSFFSTKNLDPKLLEMNPDLSLINSREYKNNSDKWFLNSDFKIDYKFKNSVVYAGKTTQQWGNGNSSLMISDNVPSFPKFGFSWGISQQLNLEYFYGNLASLIPDSSYQKLYRNNIGEREKFINRSIAAHKLTWKPNKYIEINASESVIFSRQAFELNYLIPFLPFWSLQNYNGDIDNVQMQGEVIFFVKDNYNLFGSLFIDEWTPEWTFKDKNRNWAGYQIGFKAKEIANSSDEFVIEYSWIDHRVYRHLFPVNASYSHNYTLGFWAGPHSQELYLRYKINLSSFKIETNASFVKRGELTNQMLNDQYNNVMYKRFSGSQERRTYISLKINKNIHKNFADFSIGADYIDWENPGFDPYNPKEQGKNISKFSINASLQLALTFISH
tara:strand:+ start:135059 stop:136417 length:1359 start_codon:yes stop_codon:yes gene_type:complete